MYISDCVETICTYQTALGLYMYISNCAETVYELTLLPNDTASGTLLHKSGVEWIFIIGVPARR